jgi:hypothetical protein
VQRGAQAERTGSDYHNVRVHQAIVPDRRVRTGGAWLGQPGDAIAAIVTANSVGVSSGGGV